MNYSFFSGDEAAVAVSFPLLMIKSSCLMQRPTSSESFSMLDILKNKNKKLTKCLMGIFSSGFAQSLMRWSQLIDGIFLCGLKKSRTLGEKLNWTEAVSGFNKKWRNLTSKFMFNLWEHTLSVIFTKKISILGWKGGGHFFLLFCPKLTEEIPDIFISRKNFRVNKNIRDFFKVSRGSGKN